MPSSVAVKPSLCLTWLGPEYIFSTMLISRGVKLGHVKNALFGVFTIAMYTTPKSASLYASFGIEPHHYITEYC